MKFTESQANQAVSLLGTKASGKDKRRAPRRDIRAGIRITTAKNIGAELRDLSARGARIWVAEPVAHGTQFTLMLPSKPGTTRSPIICQVVHCRRDPAGGFSLGVEFVGSVQKNTQTAAENEAQSNRIRDSILE